MYYFAYGSNLSKKQMLERCPDSKPGSVATLPNYKLVFAGWSRKWHGGVASIKSFRGERVRGAIYEVTEKCLRELDRHEAGYGRFKVTVFDEDDEPIEAITYIKAGQLDDTLPSKDYLAVIQQGYRDWRLF
ncbi:gamma-glutamylcyclotransferase family protein [Chloroflexota bacterium]